MHFWRVGVSAGPKNGSILTHSREKIDASRIDHNTTMVGVRFCRPMRPLRKGYKWRITHTEKNNFPKRGPHDWYPLLRASEKPATIPTRLITNSVVGGMSRVVHLNAYSSPNSLSSEAFAVTVKLVSMPANTLENCKKMSRDSSNHPKLFVPPPFFDAHSTPSQFQNARHDNGDEEEHEIDACKITQLYQHHTRLEMRSLVFNLDCSSNTVDFNWIADFSNLSAFVWKQLSLLF